MARNKITAIISPLLFGFALSNLAMPAQAANLYRWNDDEGNVYYTDRVPPQYIKRGYRVLSEQGITIVNIAPSQPAPAKVDKKSAKEIAEEQRLLTTYANESEINATRDRRIEDIQAIIKMTEEAVYLLDNRFRQLTKEASDYEKQGEAIAEELQADLDTTQKKISAYQAAIKRHEQQLNEVKQQYNDELEHFRKIHQALKQEQP